MKAFEIGKTYEVTSICNSDCVWRYTVTARTEKTVTIEGPSIDGCGKKVCRIIKGLSEIRGSESVYPLGKYSMCPILSA